MGNEIRIKLAQGISLLSTGKVATVTATASTLDDLSITFPDETVSARLYFEGDDIRMWENGVPTATQGMIMSDGNLYDIDNRYNLDNAKFILKTGSTTSKIHIQFYK